MGVSIMSNLKKDGYFYDGDDEKYQPPIGGFSDSIGRKYFPYFPGDDLKEAVNLAIDLNRPLLLEGEPGCGKTRLAGAIAYEFMQKSLAGKKDETGKLIKWSYHIWNVKSVGRARDGLYNFDAVGRLRDAQLVGMNTGELESLLQDKKKPGGEFDRVKARLRDIKEYRKFGPLGAVLSQSVSDRSVLLIDEIDKADSDFPNDLLLELDQLRFEISETEEQYPLEGCEPKPIIIITSNQERPLPEAFLRRCLYFFVEFPDAEALRKVILGRFGKAYDNRLEFIERVIVHFLAVREVLSQEPGAKLPGTSEILDFLKALEHHNPEESIAALENLANRSPLLGIVLKTQQDQERYRSEYGSRG
jgi:MoxR-like ATPase